MQSSRMRPSARISVPAARGPVTSLDVTGTDIRGDIKPTSQIHALKCFS